jgi:HK97 family phage portal protein
LGIWDRLFGSKQKAAEGAYRPGPYMVDDGWLSAKAGQFMNWWQMGYSIQPYGEGSAMVEACISAYSQTTAMCPGDHWKSLGNGGRERITTSDLSRILRRPNDYQSISDLMLNLTRRLYSRGEAFAVAIRNNRNEVAELHLMRNGQPLIAEDGSIFYYLSGNEIVERRFDFTAPIPARDVLHVKLHTPRHELKGESPILATTLDLALSGAALNQQTVFYINQSRPSFMLETDQQLTKEQTADLRKRWNEQTTGENSGGTAILAWGLKAKPVETKANDGQLAEMLKMTDQNVALAFRVPLQVLGVGGTPFASTEALMSAWKASGLGFCLNHIEEAFGLLFKLKGVPEEYVEFDTKSLLRSSFKEMIEALSNGTRRVMTPNEGRSFLDLPEKEGGDQLFVQMQDIPLSMAGKQTAPVAPTTPNPPPTDTGDAGSEDDPAPEKDLETNERARQSFRSAYAQNRTIAA